MNKNLRMLLSITLIAALIPLQACSSLLPTTGSQSTPTATTPTTSPLTTAVQTTTPSTNAPSTTLPQTSPQTNGGQTVDYQILHTIPDSIKSSVEGLKKDRGYYFFDKEQILVVFMGERSTGGYSLSLQTIQRKGDTLLVSVVEKSPKPGDMVTQALTYPMLILQLDQIDPIIEVLDQTGKAYPKSQGNLY